MSAVNFPAICAAHNLTNLEVSYRTGEGISPWGATAHGVGIGIGQHGCTFGYGNTPLEAVDACIASALAYRDARGIVTDAAEVVFES